MRLYASEFYRNLRIFHAGTKPSDNTQSPLQGVLFTHLINGVKGLAASVQSLTTNTLMGFQRHRKRKGCFECAAFSRLIPWQWCALLFTMCLWRQKMVKSMRIFENRPEIPVSQSLSKHYTQWPWFWYQQKKGGCSHLVNKVHAYHFWGEVGVTIGVVWPGSGFAALESTVLQD